MSVLGGFGQIIIFQICQAALLCIRNAWTGGVFAAATLDAHISRFTAVRELLGLKRELLRAVAKEQHPSVHDAFMPLAATDNFVVRPLNRCLLMCLSRWESLRIVSCKNRSAVTQFECA